MLIKPEEIIQNYVRKIQKSTVFTLGEKLIIDFFSSPSSLPLLRHRLGKQYNSYITEKKKLFEIN